MTKLEARVRLWLTLRLLDVVGLPPHRRGRVLEVIITEVEGHTRELIAATEAIRERTRD